MFCLFVECQHLSAEDTGIPILFSVLQVYVVGVQSSSSIHLALKFSHLPASNAQAEIAHTFSHAQGHLWFPPQFSALAVMARWNRGSDQSCQESECVHVWICLLAE